MASQYQLVVREGPNAGHTFALEGAVVTMGRASDNTVVFDSSRVSRHHAQIRFSESGVVIEDLGSTNGTWLNDRQLTEPRPLSSGDLVRLADYVTLEFVAEDWGRTEQLGAESAGHATQVMTDTPAGAEAPPQDQWLADYGGPVVEPYTPQKEQQPASQRDVAYQPAGGEYAVTPAPPSAVSLEQETQGARRPRWMYVLIGLLVLAICLCVAIGVYLWFAPVTFWERVFDLVGLPMPSGYLEGRLLSLL
jgi:pSer/pThr/pTyr-binding forkhead associated (FHA) protein